MTQDLIANRYAILKTLHTGRSRIVHLVDDRYAPGPPCILKELTNTDVESRALFRFHEEYRLLSDLSHPGLVRPRRISHGVDTNPTFMVEEAAPGCSLKLYTGLLTDEFLYGFVLSMARVLSYLHARGIVHFDVKPANIIVDTNESGALIGVRLVDFDLMGRAGDETSVRGTPLFIAPEVKESGTAADGRADLFSLGVTLLALLNGGTEGLPDDITPEAIEDVVDNSESLPDWVAPLIRSLTQGDCTKRPSTGREVIAMVDAGAPLETPETRVAAALRPRFVGRTEELSRLRNSMPFSHRPSHDRPRSNLPIVLISGERGVGKTRLLERHEVALATSRVATVRVSPGHGSPVDLQAFVRRVQDAQGARATGEREQAARRSNQPSGAWQVNGEVGARRFGWFDALAQPMLRVTRERPLAVLLDDVHQFDDTSADFLCFLLRRLANQLRDRSGSSSIQIVLTGVRHRLPLVLSDLVDDLSEEGLLGEVTVNPLPLEAANVLLEEMTAPDTLPASCAEWFMERTHGNPMFLRETLLSLLDAADEKADFEDAFTQERLQSAPVASRVRRVVQQRLDRVESKAQNLMHLIALHPARADDGLLARATGMPRAQVAASLENLIRRGLLARGARGGIRFLDTDVLDVVREGIDGKAARGLHDRLASALADSQSSLEIWSLPCHLMEGSDQESGWGAALVSWTELLRTAHIEQALVVCDAVLNSRQDPPASLRRMAALAGAEICVGKGDVAGARMRLNALTELRLPTGPIAGLLNARLLANQGNFAESRECLKQAIAFIEPVNPVAIVQLILFEAHTFLQQRLFKDAVSALDDATERLSHLGDVPVLESVATDSPLSEITTPAVTTAHPLVPELGVLIRLQGEIAFRMSDLRRALSLALLAIEIESKAGGSGLTLALRLAGNSYMVGGEYALAFQFFNKAVALHENSGDLVGLADTYNNLGILKRKQGKTSDAIDYLLKSLRLRKETGHREGEIQSYLNIANIHLSRRELAPAARYLNVCLKLKRKLTDDANPAIILNSLGAVAELRDRLAAASRYYESAVRADRSFGNVSGAVTWQINSAMIQLKVGNPKKAQRLASRSLRLAIRRSMPQEIARSQWVLAGVHLHGEQTTEALRCLNDALEAVGDASMGSDRIATLVQIMGVHVARGDDEAAERVRDLIRPLEPDVVSNETELDLLIHELRLLGRQAVTSVPQEQIENLIEHAKNATRRSMPGAAYRASSALAFHFNELGDSERAFYYFSSALASFEESVQAIGDAKMAVSFMQMEGVQRFKHEAELFVERHCPGLWQEDARLPREVRSVFQSLKKGFFDVERSMGTTVAHLRRNEEGIRRILEISQTLSSTASSDELLVQVVDGVMDFSGAERGFVILLDDSGEMQIPVARTGFREPVLEPERQLSRNIIEQVIETRRPVLVQNAMDDENYRIQESVINLELRSIMVAPLLRGELLLGMLYVDNRSRVGQFPEEDLELLAIFATQVAIALENSRLVQEFVRDEKMRIMGMMAGGVAHDFNNLLATIIGRTQLLREEHPDGEINSGLRTVEKAARDGAAVVRRLQDYTRISRQSDMIVTRVKSLVADVIEFTRTQWESEAFRSGRHIDVENAVDPKILVACNPSELREVFTNITLNALAAMPDGGSIRFEAETDHERVRIKVIDTGIGMSETIRSNIFDPFFTTRDEDGTGLGMSIVYGILMRHGGAVSVESEAGKGSTIVIELPRALGRVAEEETGELEAATPRPDGTQTILVVDDEADIRTLLTEILESVDYTVLQAGSGAAALELMDENKIDCVLTDLGMSPMSGWELAREIKSNHEIPIILVTGWAGEIDPAQAKENQVDQVVSKPFDPEEIFEVVHRACNPCS